VIGSQPVSLADAHYKNSFYLTSGVFGATGIVTYLKQYLHAKKVAMLSANDIPVAVAAAGVIKHYLKAYGFQVTQGTFAASATSYLPAVTAAHASTADAVLALVILPDQCLGMARSLKEAAVDKPVISFYTCVTNGVRQTFGDYPKWTYFSFIPNVLGPGADAQQSAEFKAFHDWIAPIASQIPDQGDAANNLSTVLTIAKIFNELGPASLSTASVSSRFTAFHGPVLLGPPKLDFGGVSLFSQIGTLGSVFPTYQGNGKWTDPTHGTWLVPPNISPGIYN
jgi:branched-chain amino acid transport system substrate-binding protein